jgi:hypothetical protein
MPTGSPASPLVPSMRGVGIWAILVELLILSAVEAHLARRVEAAIPVVAPAENGDVVKTVIVIEKTADTVPLHLPDQ